jgi:glycosyltransferase involved in cell wall biosynthesis
MEKTNFNGNFIKFSDKSAVIVCHDAMFGPPHELRDYMIKHGIRKLLFIGHQNRVMIENDITSSYYELYKHGILLRRFISPVIKLPELLGYVKDALLTMYWSIIIMKRIDYFIGLGNLNAFVGLLLKITGHVSHTIYYVIDYIPHRFTSTLVNALYHYIDYLSARYSDMTWNFGGRMIEERELKWKQKLPHQIVVPNGIRIRSPLILPYHRIHKRELVYLGVIHDKQGLQIVIRSLPVIAKSIPSIRLVIIGKGIYRKSLEKLSEIYRVKKYVRFLGYIKDPVAADRRVAYGALGLAMYDPWESVVIYTEPGKVKRYLSVGVPVIMTDIKPLSAILQRNKCGIVSPYDPNIFARKVIQFMRNSKVMRYRKNAIRFAKLYEWDTIFAEAFRKSHSSTL